MSRRTRRIAPFTLLALLTTIGIPTVASAADAGDEECSTGGALDDPMTELFDGDGSFAGADYQRTIPLDDGRMLWLFQDVFVDGGGRLVHNGAAIQDGGCIVELLDDGGPFIAAAETDPFDRWFWPLDGYQLDDDTVLVYVAEMAETGDHYLDRTTPVATWTVEVDLETMEAGSLRPAPDASAALYGWAVETDGEHTYLYAHCYLQFGFGLIGHDECTRYVTVARQPAGDPHAPLAYWDGVAWVDDPDAAVNIAPTEAPDGAPRYVNPMQIEVVADGWIAVTKEGDWWGDRIYFDVAPSPEGPWTTTAVVPVEPTGDPDVTNTYFASFVTTDGPGVTLAISNNRWDGRFSDTYRPTVRTVPMRLWAPREPAPNARGSWLPTGDPLW